jgi:predicted metal-dependent hydrolase
MQSGSVCVRNWSEPLIPIDQLIRSRRKTIALIVTREGKLVVRAPLRTPRAQIEAAVAEKSAWILAHQQKMQSRPRLEARKFSDGESFLYLGGSYPLKILPTVRGLVFQKNQFCLSPAAQPRAAELFEAWYKSQARIVLAERIAFHAARLGFQPGQLRIGSARTRWGSCSSLGTLSFTWRLVLAPLEVIDYVVVHELVHLAVKNHSRAFWQRVAQAYPTYQAARAWLKEHAGLGEDLLAKAEPE